MIFKNMTFSALEVFLCNVLYIFTICYIILQLYYNYDSGAVSKQSFSHHVSAWTLLEISVLCFTPIASYSIVKCSCSPRTL